MAETILLDNYDIGLRQKLVGTNGPVRNGSSPRGTIFTMPTEHILALLIAERDKLNRAIEALQGPTKRRGRPPKNPLAAAMNESATVAPATAQRKRPHFTPAQRAAAAERMRQRWAAKRKAEGKTATKAKKAAKAAA
jgi:hypothetical protein